MVIGDICDASAIRRQLFPPRIVRGGPRQTTRVSSDPSRNSSGGDYDEWARPTVVSADPTEAMPIGMAFMGKGRGGRAFYKYVHCTSSSEWFDMCRCCGTYGTTYGKWGFCAGCDPIAHYQGNDYQDAEVRYSFGESLDQRGRWRGLWTVRDHNGRFLREEET